MADKSLILNYHVGGFRQPRLNDGIVHPCTSIKADGTVTTFTSKRAPRATTPRTAVTVKNDNAAQFARMLQLGSNNTIY